MLGTFKAYITMFIGAIVLGFLAYMKYLKASNEEQKENIERLTKEIVVRKEVAKDEVKKAVFDAKQKTKAKALSQYEITMDEIEKEIKENEAKQDTKTVVNDDYYGDEFITSSV